MDEPRQVSREDAARWGMEAVTIAKRGWYDAPSGRRVELAEDVAEALRGTRSYSPRDGVGLYEGAAKSTRIEVKRESTLAAAQRLVREGYDVAALNFASARNPGGGFLSGARAQEESLCRASALYVCLEGQAMYEYHARHTDALYASWMIYSPEVPVFRSDDGPLLEEPWRCAFLTAAAPNAKVLFAKGRAREAEVREALFERAERVCALAAACGHNALVLGAWGCGAFGCDGDTVAEAFEAALEKSARGAFERVLFAILDTTPTSRFAGPFEARFGGRA